jgi:hypothetical protein
MSRVGRLQVERVRVLAHAIEQARDRGLLSGKDEEIRAEIERRVRVGVEQGQVFDVKPRSFRGARSARNINTMLPGQRLVVSGECGFVVDLGLLPTVEVVTTMRKLQRV